MENLNTDGGEFSFIYLTLNTALTNSQFHELKKKAKKLKWHELAF